MLACRTALRCPPKVKALDYQGILGSALGFIRPRSNLVRNCHFPPLPLLRASRYRFQQDGASVHRARSTVRYLQQNAVRLFWGDRWPPNSPDMNPIEHLWPIVTAQLSGQVFAGREALWIALQAAFAAIPPSKVMRLYESMPSRLAALKLARGGDRKSTRLNSSHTVVSRMPSSA